MGTNKFFDRYLGIAERMKACAGYRIYFIFWTILGIPYLHKYPIFLAYSIVAGILILTSVVFQRSFVSAKTCLQTVSISKLPT